MPEISCIANPGYDPERPADLRDESFKAESRLHAMESKDPEQHSSWSVELDLSQQPDDKANVPYHFQVKLVGLFRCSNKPSDVPQEAFVRTNGSSILYGIAREFLRSLTAVGPWSDMLLPTVSFYPDAPTAPEPPKKLKERKGPK